MIVILWLKSKGTNVWLLWCDSKWYWTLNTHFIKKHYMFACMWRYSLYNCCDMSLSSVIYCLQHSHKNKIFLKSFWFSSHSWPLDLSCMCCYNVMLSKQRNQKLIITPRDSCELLVARLNLKKKYIIFVNPHLTMMKVIECKFKIKMEEWISKKIDKLLQWCHSRLNTKIIISLEMYLKFANRRHDLPVM